MIKEHHKSTVEAAKMLIEHWQENNISPKGIDKDKIAGLYNQLTLDEMKSWVALADEVNDIAITPGLTEFIVEWMSHATCFQHFAYCGFAYRGSKGSKEGYGGDLDLYEGYCWKKDPHRDASKYLAKVTKDPVLYEMDATSLGPELAQCMKSELGEDYTESREIWRFKEFISAPELALHYENCARRLRDADGPEEAWGRSLLIAVHLIQDMSVPHHVICTIFLDHGIFEGGMYNRWAEKYDLLKRDLRYDEMLRYEASPFTIDDLSAKVEILLNGEFNDPQIENFMDLGLESVGQTILRLPPQKIFFKKMEDILGDDPTLEEIELYKQAKEYKLQEAVDMTALAIASTIKALAMFV